MPAAKRKNIVPSPFAARKAAVDSEGPPVSEPVTVKAADGQRTFPIYPGSGRAATEDTWVGTGYVVVLKAKAPPDLVAALSKLPETAAGSEEQVEALITGVVRKPIAYRRAAVVPVVYYEAPEGRDDDDDVQSARVDVDCGVYIAGPKKSPKVVYFNQAFGPAPSTLYAPDTEQPTYCVNDSTAEGIDVVAACLGTNGGLLHQIRPFFPTFLEEACALAHFIALAEAVEQPANGKDDKIVAGLRKLDLKLLQGERERVIEAFGERNEKRVRKSVNDAISRMKEFSK